MLCRALKTNGFGRNINNYCFRSFCGQQKILKEEKETKTEGANETFDNENETENENDNTLIVLTPKQKLREWTRSFHMARTSVWIRNSFGNPLVGIFKKYNESRYLQKMYATRILRREKLGELWKVNSIVSAPDIIATDSDKYDKEDLDYLFYHCAPLAYKTSHKNSDKNGKNKNDNNDDRDSIDEEVLVSALQYWYDTFSERLYWNSFDYNAGHLMFSHVKFKEYQLRNDAIENAVRDEETNILKPKDPNLKINPYVIIPEENYRSEFIQYGGRFLSDFVDLKVKKEFRRKDRYLDTGYTNKINQKLIDDDDDGGKDDNALADYKKTEGYEFNKYWFGGWLKGKVSSQPIEEHIKDIENIEYGVDTEQNKDDWNRVFAERKKIDMRTDLRDNKRFSGWYQLKRMVGGKFKEEVPIYWKMKTLALKHAFGLLKTNYKFVFQEQGGALIRNGYPPQVSIQEFTVNDQMECAIGSFGTYQSLFSDWFLIVDNKRDNDDKSYGTAVIQNDRLVFEGFLIHSAIEMGHRGRNAYRDFVGFVNLQSSEFEPEIDLGAYHSIGIKLKSDGRPYFLGLECLIRNKFMIFNGIIQLPPTPDDEWDHYEIPLHHFRPYDRGEFIEGENHLGDLKVRWVRSIGLQAVGNTGPFKIEIEWIRAFQDNARFDIEDEDAVFIQDIDALGLYEKDLNKFHIIQHQYFIDSFADPFRFEDNGVFDDKVYLGPPRAVREHFAKLPPDFLRYIDVPDDVPRNDNYYLNDDDDMMMFEMDNTNKLIGTTKAIQHLYKNDSQIISDATNNLLYNALKNQSKHNKYLSINYNSGQTSNNSDNHIPFIFKDITQTANTPLTILTHRRRELIRETIPEQFRERQPGKHPHLI